MAKRRINIEESIPLLVATPYGHIQITTIAALITAAEMLGRNLEIFTRIGNQGIPMARSQLFRDVSEALGGAKKTRGLIIDSDIVFEQPNELAAYIKTADQHGWNLIANYYAMHDGKKEPTLHRREDGAVIPYTEEELEKMSDLASVDGGGLGFYYGDLPLDYIFHSANKGEDVNFFEDNAIAPRFMKKIVLGHIKHIVLK